MSDAMVLSRIEGPVAWVTLNRPARLNAFAYDMRDRLADAVLDAGASPAVRVIVVTGGGRAFCAGADVDALLDLAANEDHHEFAALVQAGMRAVRAIRDVPQPVVAAINGVAAGAGAALAAACDIRIAAASAALGFTFNRVGLHPDWGATYFLPRLVGRGRAAELVLTGRLVPAAEAERIGLVERVVPDASFEAAVREFAAELATKPALPVSLAKASLNGTSGGLLDEALRAEAEAQLQCFRSGDVREGAAAFREKRAPRFHGE